MEILEKIKLKNIPYNDKKNEIFCGEILSFIINIAGIIYCIGMLIYFIVNKGFAKGSELKIFETYVNIYFLIVIAIIFTVYVIMRNIIYYQYSSIIRRILTISLLILSISVFSSMLIYLGHIKNLRDIKRNEIFEIENSVNRVEDDNTSKIVQLNDEIIQIDTKTKIVNIILKISVALFIIYNIIIFLADEEWYALFISFAIHMIAVPFAIWLIAEIIRNIGAIIPSIVLAIIALYILKIFFEGMGTSTKSNTSVNPFDNISNPISFNRKNNIVSKEKENKKISNNELRREKRGDKEIINVPKHLNIYRAKSAFGGTDYVEASYDLFAITNKLCSIEEFEKGKVIIIQEGQRVENVYYKN